MIKPGLTTFAARGHLALTGAFGRRTIDYWYYPPFFWRVEQDGELVIQVGHASLLIQRDQLIFDVRLVARPEMLAHQLGLSVREPRHTEHHSETGRPAHRCALDGSTPGTMLVDTATGIVLLLHKGNGAREIECDTTDFKVTETLDPALFGETSLEVHGYYHGSLG